MTPKHPETGADRFSPPMQNDPGVYIFDYQNPDTLPYFRFVIARIADGQVEITKSIPVHEPIEDGERFTELVTQTYTIEVPCTEEVDGNSVTEMRTETRTRRVPITKTRASKIAEVGEAQSGLAERSYSVTVPYTENVNGLTVMRSRVETRSRLVSVDEPPANFVPRSIVGNYPLEELKCYSMTGISLSVEDVAKRLSVSVPVILVNDAKYISSYFERLLQPDTVFIIDPTASSSSRDLMP